MSFDNYDRLFEVVNSAICWRNDHNSTIGNVPIFSQEIVASITSDLGLPSLKCIDRENVFIPCDFVPAGKFRHGAERQWCRTHQTYWGTKADIQQLAESGKKCCKNHKVLMNFTTFPLPIDLDERITFVPTDDDDNDAIDFDAIDLDGIDFDDLYDLKVYLVNIIEAFVSCSLPPAISSQPIEPRPPKIRVHTVNTVNTVTPYNPYISDEPQERVYADDYHVVTFFYKDKEHQHRIDVTPPIVLDFVKAIEDGREDELGILNCPKCGFPHSDLGSFATNPHRKHLCANCGSDSIWSPVPMASSVLKPLYDRFGKTCKYQNSEKFLNLDSAQYQDCDYVLKPTFPLFVYLERLGSEHLRTLPVGVHAWVFRKNKDGSVETLVQDVFGTVKLRGEFYDREQLVPLAFQNTIGYN